MILHNYPGLLSASFSIKVYSISRMVFYQRDVRISDIGFLM